MGKLQDKIYMKLTEKCFDVSKEDNELILSIGGEDRVNLTGIIKDLKKDIKNNPTLQAYDLSLEDKAVKKVLIKAVIKGCEKYINTENDLTEKELNKIFEKALNKQLKKFIKSLNKTENDSKDEKEKELVIERPEEEEDEDYEI